jgi:tRNA(Ile)-lysidine synthase
MRGAHPDRAIEQAIESSDVIRRGEHVLAACSGGPDSVALVAALHSVAKSMALRVRIAHVNHAVRESAWQDECVVLRIATAYELPLDIATLQNTASSEQVLRRARYARLIETARKHGCTAIATAHHAEDQSETVLLALLRGAGPQGLAGMRARRPLGPGLDLARPFLTLSSEALRAYCHARALPYAVDPTNADDGRRRNAVREALDTLRQLFPGLDRAVARAAQLTAEEKETSRRADLRRSVREYLAEEDTLRDIDFAHVEAAVRTLQRGGTGTFHMKPGLALRIERGSVSGISRE